jgi:hypothetical protein
MQQVLVGNPRAMDEPPARVEALYSDDTFSRMTGWAWEDAPCEFAIYDVNGLRLYPLEYDCQVDVFSNNSDSYCETVHSDGETLMALRVIDFDAGLSELIMLPIMVPNAEPTVLYRGEIDYMLQNTAGASLSVLGADGKIPAIERECLFVDTAPFQDNNRLLATQRGVYIIPAEEFNGYIMAVSPDKARVLLSNGAIYDVVEDRLVINITGGARIHPYTKVTWQESGQLVFTENDNPETDEQVIIRLRFLSDG